MASLVGSDAQPSDPPNPDGLDSASRHLLPPLVLGAGDGLGFGGGLSPARIALVDGLDAATSRGFELRVHGVGGSSGEQILEHANTVQVGGDQIAQFIRRWAPIGVARRAHPPWPVEGYWWGGLTSRPGTRALWVLVFPLMLCNMASWMLPASGENTGKRQKLAAAGMPPVMRLAGYALTLLLTASLATASMDVFGWQCAMAPARPAGHGRTAACLPGWLRWTPAAAGPRLSVFALIPIIVLAVMGYASHRTLRAYERWEVPEGMTKDSKLWPLTAAGFWHGLRPVRRQQLLHLAGAGGLLSVYLAAVHALHPWAIWMMAAVLVGLPAIDLLCPQAGRSAVNPHGDRPSDMDTGSFDGVCGATLLLSAAVLMTFLIAGIWWRPAIPSHAPAGLLPGDSLVWLILTIAFGGLLLVTFVLTAMAQEPDERDRDKAFARGFLGPLTLGLSLVSGGIFAGGLNLLLPSLLIRSPFRTIGPAITGHLSTPLVLPVPVYGFMNALLVMTAALIALVLIGTIWFLTEARRTWQADYLDRFYDGEIRSKGTWRQRVPIGVAWTFAKVADQTGIAVATLSLTGIAGAVVFGFIALQAAHPDWVITTAHYGQWIGLGVAVLLLGLTRQAFTSGGTRRTVGTLWDVGTFWPRASQPLAPPCYMERSVPEIVNRLRRALGDQERERRAPEDQQRERRAPGDQERDRRARGDHQREHRNGDPATDISEPDRIETLRTKLGGAADRVCLGTQDWVLINGYSQGSPIAAAVIAQLPQELWQKVSLQTVGSPLRRLYGRAFPAYFGQRCLLELASMLGAAQAPGQGDNEESLRKELGKARWRNARRPSDYIGSYIFKDPMGLPAQDNPRGLPASKAQGDWGVDRLILDPPRIIPGRATTPPPIHAHSDFWPDPQVAFVTCELIPVQ